MNKMLEHALKLAEESASLAYRFTPGSYTASLISDVAAIRVALEPSPDWIKELEEYNSEET
jgi:hypothetical protein